jgi:hypothetical protein
MNETLKAEIKAAVAAAGTVATFIAPQYTAFIVLGQALAKAAPEVYDGVVKLLQKAEPTETEVAELHALIEGLNNPDSIV